MSRISDLVLLYLHKKLAASGDTPATLTASAGTIRTAVCAALTEADDYWNGAILRWTTGPNAGRYSSVLDFDAATDTLTFKEDLPNAVANTHQFVLLHGGKHASDQQIPGMVCTAPVNVTGFTISYVSFRNLEGNAELNFKHNGGVNQGLTWTPPDGDEGIEVNISALANGDTAVLSAGGATDEEKSAFVIVTRTAAALPGADQSDTLGLSLPEGTFLPAITGAETTAGKTFYRPVAIKNNGAGKIYSVKAYCLKPVDAAAGTTIAASGGIGTGADELGATNLANWPVSGFVYNSTKDDLRYYYDKSGNGVKVQSPGAGIRGFTAVAWDDGDTLELFPLFDIGLDAPGAGSIFEDPATEITAPAGVGFSCPRTSGTGLNIGDLAAGGLHVVWERYFIPANFQPVEAARALLRLYAEVSSI